MTATNDLRELTFDAELHRYTIAGRELPSVTQVIGDILPGWQSDEWYMQRGSAMHRGCELLDAGTLDIATVAPEISGRLAAWGRFRNEFECVAVARETQLAHSLYQFAGTLDGVFRDGRGDEVLLDIKSSICAQVDIQLGAYSLLWQQDHPRIKRAVAVQLSDDGSYRTHWLDRRGLEESARIFLACLTIYGFKIRKGIK